MNTNSPQLPTATPVCSLAPEAWPIERQCDDIAEYYISQWGCVQLMLAREYGNDLLAATKQRVLRRHQREYFLPGVDKLGISRDLPPAVIAARYHYFSNIIGSIKMEYIEESPKKVWIRYRAPSFSFTGIGLAAVTSKVQRSMFSGWHPFNGISLGCPNLGFVVTKTFQDGEPYDEGYFQEFDAPLHDDERIQFQPVTMTPDWKPELAPQLDEKLWPDVRRAKANRNFARGYLEDTLLVTLELVGVHETATNIAQALRIFAVQFDEMYLKRFGISGRRAVDFAQYHSYLAEMADEAPQVTEVGPGKYRIERLNKLGTHSDMPLEIYHALFERVKLSAKIMSPRIRVTLESLEKVMGQPARETWLIEDTAERLF